MSTTGGAALAAAMRKARAMPAEVVIEAGFKDRRIAALAATHEFGLRGRDGGVALPERPAFRKGVRDIESQHAELDALFRTEGPAAVALAMRDILRRSYLEFQGTRLSAAQRARKAGTPYQEDELVGGRGAADGLAHSRLRRRRAGRLREGETMTIHDMAQTVTEAEARVLHGVSADIREALTHVPGDDWQQSRLRAFTLARDRRDEPGGRAGRTAVVSRGWRGVSLPCGRQGAGDGSSPCADGCLSYNPMGRGRGGATAPAAMRASAWWRSGGACRRDGSACGAFGERSRDVWHRPGGPDGPGGGAGNCRASNTVTPLRGCYALP